MEKQVEEKLFIGGMNQDDSQNLIGPHEYLSARNVIITSPSTSGDGEIQNIPGTQSLFGNCSGRTITGTNLATVVNYGQFGLGTSAGYASFCIGCKEDIVKKRIYWFVCNALNGTIERTSIFYYDYDANRINQIALDLNNSILQFGNGLNDPTYYIDSVDFIHLSNGDTMLCWTQKGVDPRELYVERSMSSYTANGTVANWASPIKEYILDIKRPPSRGPVPYKNGNTDLTKNMGMDNDATPIQSFEFDGCQFSMRYVYYNGNTSTWSSCSAYFANKLVDINDYSISPITPITNRIRIDLRDPLLWTTYTQGSNISTDTFTTFKSQFIDLIQYIEISFREDYNLPWKFVDRVPFSTNYNNNAYAFNAQGNYIALSPEETDQPFDLTPLIAGSVKIAKNKKIYGNITEDFDYNETYATKITGLTIKQDTSTTSGYPYQKCYPSNSNYPFGIEFFDEFGRTSSIYANDSTVLKTGNFSALANIIYGIKLAFTFGTAGVDYPSWAKGFRIKRGENQSSSFIARGLVNNIQYVRGYVNSNIKTYNVDDSTTGSAQGLNVLFITDSKVPKDILPGDRVFGSYENGSGISAVPEGTVVAKVFYDGTDSYWKILLSQPLDAGSPAPFELSFQSLGVQPASYITNQVNGITVPQVTEVGTAERARQTGTEFGGATQGTFGLGQLGGVIVGAIRYADADDERIRQQNVRDLALARRGFIQEVAQSYLNADFQIGNPMYMHSSYYPTGAQLTNPNCKGTIGQFGVATTDFECKELHIEIGNWFKNEYGLPYIWQEGDLLTITLARTYYDVENVSFVKGTDTITCDADANITTGALVVGYGIPSGATVLTVNTPGAVTSFTISEDTISDNAGYYQIQSLMGDIQGISSTVFVDLKIKNTRGTTLIIDCPSGYNPFDSGNDYHNLFFNTQCEISVRRPIIQKQQYLQYYDIGQTFYLPFTGSVYLGTISGATNDTEGGILAGDTLNYMGDGDCYIYSSRAYGNSDTLANSGDQDFGPNLNIAGIYITPNINKRTYYWDKDLGRPNLVLQNKEKQVSRKQLIRWSLLYSQSSSINNTNRFIYKNQLEVSVDWGSITKLAFGQNRLLILCDRESGTAFVDENLLVVDSTSGEERVSIAYNTINNARKLQGQYGCVDPASVYNYENDIRWYSKPKGRAVVYSDYAGIDDFSKMKMISYFYKARVTTGLVLGGYDPQNGQALFSFTSNYSGVGSGGEVVAYDDDELKKWIAFHDYRPEGFAYMNNDFYSFKDGIPHRHGVSATYSSIYGNTVVPSVSIVFNKEPSHVKMFKVLTQRGNSLWVTPVNGIDCDNLNSASLMQTDVLSNQWELINQEYWADVLFDKNTPGAVSTDDAKYNGDPLIGKILRVTIQNTATTLAKIFNISLVSDINKRTNN